MKEYKNKKGEVVEVTVKVFTGPNLRGYTHDTLLYIGRHFLDNIFDRKIVDEQTTEVFFYYPETWANIAELRALMRFTFHFYPNIKKLSVVTHSVYIIQTVQSENIRIMDDPSEFSESDDPKKFMSPKPDNDRGLMVFRGYNA